MSRYQVECMGVGELQTNCYLFINTETREGFVVDPGGSPLRISARIAELEIRPVAIVLTHGHFDHFGGAESLQKRYEIPVIIHEADAKLLESPMENLSAPFTGIPITMKADRTVVDGETLTLAGADFQVIFTPGHTPGGMSLYLPAEAEGEKPILFSGDTLFCESLGRTDFPGGNTKTLVRSICQRLLLALPEETIVYPGHNDATTIGYEKKWNPTASYLSHFTKS